MARIRTLINRVADGRGGVLALAGMSGIGKTRLVEESLAIARDRGFATVSGAARVLGRSQAYAMWVDALGPWLAGLAAPEGARLVAGLPDLGRLFTDLRLAPPVPLLDAGLERTRLFEAVARLVARMAERTPLVVAFDDLHWADQASVELLHYVARGVADRPILAVAAYRTDEIDTTPEVVTLLRDLRRGGLLEEVRLAGLDVTATRSLATAVLGGEPPDALISSVAARTVGSPLMVTALIDELRVTGGLFQSGGAWMTGPGALDVVPAVVGDLVRGRLDRLTPGQRAFTEMVAVAGDVATVPVLAEALDVAEESVLATARELTELGVLAEVGGERYRAAHPAFAEMAYRELPEPVRRRRHAAIAAALERRRPADVVSLARHYLGGHEQVDRKRALDVLSAAGERALAVHAGAEAATCLAAARRLMADGDPRSQAVLAERLGDAWQVAGRLDAAIEAWREALSGYRQWGEPEPMARIGRHVASALWERGRFDAAFELLDEVLSAPAPGDPGSELLLAREVRTRLLASAGRTEAAEAAAAELGDLGTRLGSPRAVATAGMIRADAARQRGEYAAAYRDLLALAGALRRIDDPLLLNWMERLLVPLEMALNGAPAGVARATTMLAAAREAAVPTLEVGSLMLVAFSQFLSGDWGATWRTATDVLALGHRIASTRGVAAGLAARALVLCHRGELAAAAQCLAEARGAFGTERPTDRHVFGLLDMLDAMVLLHREEGGRLPPPAELYTGGLPLLELHLSVVGETQVAAGQPDAALVTAARLAGLGPGAPYPAALAGRLTSLAHRASGDLPGAERAAAAAIDGFLALGMPFEAARCRLERAIVIAGTQPAEAVEELRAALRVFGEHEARQYAARARRALRGLGVQPAAERRSPVAGLSDRELEVVRLVAEGLSNAAIAQRLVISPRTVTTHLQHVYARLGIGSRAALIRYAIEQEVFSTPRIRTASRANT